MHVSVDQQRCVSSGLCALAVGEVFDQGEQDGVVELLRPEVSGELAERVQRAARVCPARAIAVQEEIDA